MSGPVRNGSGLLTSIVHIITKVLCLHDPEEKCSVSDQFPQKIVYVGENVIVVTPCRSCWWKVAVPRRCKFNRFEWPESPRISRWSLLLSLKPHRVGLLGPHSKGNYGLVNVVGDFHTGCVECFSVCEKGDCSAVVQTPDCHKGSCQRNTKQKPQIKFAEVRKCRKRTFEQLSNQIKKFSVT